MEKVTLNFPQRSRGYDILIGADLIAKTGMLFQEYGFNGRVLVVTNPTVAGWYLDSLLKALTAAGYEAEAVMIPDGETYKSLEQANRIYDRLIAGRYDRTSILVALGGGVIGDLTGFAAATYLRGVSFVQIPTTLLAQVDSSIGGKVAVNHPQGKNLIGAFYQPRLVITDVLTLTTLPARELSSGMAEVIKHGIISDANYFKLVTGELELATAVDPTFLMWVVSGSCNIKADVVRADETETGLRAILNFGHTIGHSLESITGYTRFKHGEAVALGMLAAIRIAVKIDWLSDTDLLNTLENSMTRLNLPTTIPELSVTGIYQGLTMDKKVAHGKIRWVLLKGLGDVAITAEVPRTAVEEVLREMGGV